jgi:hypothetical protein
VARTVVDVLVACADRRPSAKEVAHIMAYLARQGAHRTGAHYIDANLTIGYERWVGSKGYDLTFYYDSRQGWRIDPGSQCPEWDLARIKLLQ